MSELMKRLHIRKNQKTVESLTLSANDNTLHFSNVPSKALFEITLLLSKFKLEPDSELSTESWQDVFEDLYNGIDGIESYKNSAVAVKSARLSEQWSQKVLAEKLTILQSNLSKIENAKRPVGKRLAQKLGKVFGLNYKVFLSD